MGRVREVACDSWDDFRRLVTKQLFPDGPFERGAFLFRGQKNSAWQLQASLDRLVQQLGRSDKTTLIRNMTKQFRAECEGEGVSPQVWEDPHAQLALAQHHGMPTPLLDWTDSPYVAAFFAFSDALWDRKATERAAIWALDTRHPAWSGAGVTIIRLATVGNIRLRNQCGCFTLAQTTSASLEDHVNNYERDQRVALLKFTISLDQAETAIADLELMGITASRMYPGLEGCARSAMIHTLLWPKERGSSNVNPER